MKLKILILDKSIHGYEYKGIHKKVISSLFRMRLVSFPFSCDMERTEHSVAYGPILCPHPQ